jgi:hypothetical protein
VRTPQDIWRTLGISRTADKTAIRRAYGARLRALDREGDPAAFIALRTAFEEALACCDRFDAAAEEPEPTMLQVAECVRTAPPGAVPDYLVVPDDVLDGILRQDGAVAAYRAYLGWLARGEVSLSQQEQLSLRLLARIAADQSVPADLFKEMVQTIAPEESTWPAAGLKEDLQALRARIAAYRWLETLRKKAASWAWQVPKHEIYVARLFLRQTRAIRGQRRSLDCTLETMKAYRTHEAWLGGALEAQWLNQVEARTKSKLKRKDLSGIVIFGGFVLFLLVDLLVQLL